MENNHLFDLTGKAALVTGASRGLGKAMALALAQAGADLALNARSAETLKETEQEIQRLGRKTALVPGDVTDETQVKKVVDETVKALGKIDILINNAGIWEGTYFFRLSKQDWDKVLNLNMTGVFLVAKAVARVMLKQRSGKIINMSSISGVRGTLESLAYCATKGGVIQMTKVMAIELGSAGIQVNAIAPGLFETDMTKEYIVHPRMSEYIKRIPSRRLGKPEDLAGLIVFLASKASDHITGQTIVIDGGDTLV